MNVFLTGGTGYVGLRLAAALAGAGHEVTALARSREKGAPLEALGARVVAGDVTEFEAVDIDPSQYDACFHSAALVKVKGEAREFDRVNVEGVANVARRFLDAGVERFIYTSSFMALGPSPDGRPLDESATNDPAGVHNDYERTKHLGLLEFERWVGRGLKGIAVIPCVVYGPGALTSGNLVSRTLADLILGRLAGLLGDGRQVWTYSYVEDVVEGHLAALERGRVGERYILGGESATMQEFADIAADIAGVKRVTRRIPYSVAKLAALALEAKARFTGEEPAVSREVVEIYKHHWTYSSAKAEHELNYQITPLREGLTQTIAWVKMQIEERRL